MGAKQSKRSVDISGKEAESAGEVAAAGAGGEGRVEALADADALKPQANGAPHIHEETDKEKQLDSGTPENEKDATTEKETKEGEGDKSEEKKEEVVTNGDAAETKPENGDSSPAPEEGKKPKKEKVKKKWSLRSISFSRKDKPKQEKKQKEEEPKTNGEPEKVPEEAAEATPENGAKEVAEEVKPEPVKEEKTPETPVTEPLTNGSSTPDEPKADSPALDEPAPAPAAAAAAPPAPEEAKPEVQPEQLTLNGLSLEEQKPAAPEPASEESKPEEPAVDATETVPAPEIPVKKEVCVERMPLESTPPPLPANPPPSSVVSFAATTMAPELTDASLPNTDLAISPAPHAPHAPHDSPAPPVDTINANTQLPPPLKETDETAPTETSPIAVEPIIEKVIETSQIAPEPAQHEPAHTEIQNDEPAVEIIESVIEKVEPEVDNVEIVPVVEKVENVEPVVEKIEPEIEKVEPEIKKLETKVEPEIESVQSAADNKLPEVQTIETDSGDSNVIKLEEPNASSITAAGDLTCPESNVDTFETVKDEVVPQEAARVQESEVAKLESPDVEMPPAPAADDLELPEPLSDSPDTTEDLPPPPPSPPADTALVLEDAQTNVTNHIPDMETNGALADQHNGHLHTELENLKNKSRVTPAPPALPCNGAALPEPMELSSGAESPSDLTPPPPPADSCEAPDAAPGAPPQEPIAVSDKLADLIPEVPVVPELNTQTEAARDVSTVAAVN